MARTGFLGIRINHPAQLVAAAFIAAITLGTILLLAPFATAAGGRPPLLTAVFTSTSAVCVTGLVTVDTATYWSGYGQGVILFLVQLGGFGIMTMASFAALFISHRLRLRSRLLARVETGTLDLGDVRTILVGVAKFTLLFEVVAAVALSARFWLTYDEALPRALWLGMFHAVSAFNNAGFALFSDSLIGFLGDPIILMVVAVAVIAGGLGFPVVMELRREPLRWRRWSLHTKLTVGMTVVLLVGGTIAVSILEWSNPNTLGALASGETASAGFFSAVMPRTAGFNAIDYAEVTESTHLITILLMFVGGGAAGTAGGIKVTTAAVIVLMVWAELRGDPDVSRFGRRVPAVAQRQAVSVVLIGLAALFTGNLLLIGFSDFTVSETLFEATSAFGTVGLSNGITGLFAAPAQVVLVALMFLGRVGPLTLGTALVLRERDRLYRFPEERPIIG
ncbi:MAG: potassium transporter TrkG [Acidimicrobiales bacterium]|nr:potassium transporter TrkG [Acidimicrobiales bacterium]